MIEISIANDIGTINEWELDEYIAKNSSVHNLARSGEPQYADSLGWLDVNESAPSSLLNQLQKKADEVRRLADVFVIVGVGGSNQAARAVIEALPRHEGPEILYSGNSLSPSAMAELLRRIQGKSVYVNIIAKNFETLEPGICFRVIRTQLIRQYGAEAAGRIIATGTPGSLLHEIATQNGYAFFAFPENIGGRFSALSAVGLFPMAVAGVDIHSLAFGAQTMQQHLHRTSPSQNMALRYACMRNLLLQKGYAIEMLSFFEPRLKYFSKWWIQLFSESEGKDGKALFPAASEYSEDLHSVGQYLQDGAPIIFETFLRVRHPAEEISIESSSIEDGFAYLDGKNFSDINRIAESATIQTHSRCLPCICLSIPNIDACHLGQLFYFFEFSCYLSGSILAVNPFDQPGVEAYKAVMFEKLGKSNKALY